LDDDDETMPSDEARLAALEFFVASLLAEQIKRHPGRTALETSVEEKAMDFVGQMTSKLTGSILKDYPDLPPCLVSTQVADRSEDLNRALRSLATRARELARDEGPDDDPEGPGT
jgi:hypothetical protein